jgi:uncharacterized surface protein with fasciclin (FAS1) repeats
MIRKFLSPILATLLLSLIVGCNSYEHNAVKSEIQTSQDESGERKGQAFIEDEGKNPNALQLAIGSSDHTTLVSAVQAAEVENSLVNVGPLTVFAPTNEAFGKIDEATLNDLLKPENKSDLAFILINHVAPGNFPIKSLKKTVEKGRTLYMASGENVKVEQKEDEIFVGGVKILKTIKVSNGWVHIIDELILPNEK